MNTHRVGRDAVQTRRTVGNLLDSPTTKSKTGHQNLTSPKPHTTLILPAFVISTMTSSPAPSEGPIPDSPTAADPSIPLPLSASILLTSLPQDATSALDKATAAASADIPEKGMCVFFSGLMILVYEMPSTLCIFNIGSDHRNI